ncbi:hypothetical protein LIA77_11911 [Sarocladium implicatum]|nr:hypothetical protein LIA77_11911 [Sarocladium implicatum]
MMTPLNQLMPFHSSRVRTVGHHHSTWSGELQPLQPSGCHYSWKTQPSCGLGGGSRRTLATLTELMECDSGDGEGIGGAGRRFLISTLSSYASLTALSWYCSRKE